MNYELGLRMNLSFCYTICSFATYNVAFNSNPYVTTHPRTTR